MARGKTVAMLLLSILTWWQTSVALPPDPVSCRKAFVYKTPENLVADTIRFCLDTLQKTACFFAAPELTVCDDKLCAELKVRLFWDPAGNYLRFDTLPGNPLTKFDHRRFTGADYSKLDQILRDRNSLLRELDRADLIDRNRQIRATTVDAVTGATPETIRNLVVEGAVYSSFTLWHYINDSLRYHIRSWSKSHMTEKLTGIMLASGNWDTQLFALQQFTAADWENHLPQLCNVITNSVPLTRAYILGKLPVPFGKAAQNLLLVKLFPVLDSYSRSLFLDRITADARCSAIFIPLLTKEHIQLDPREREKCLGATRQFSISGFPEKP